MRTWLERYFCDIRRAPDAPRQAKDLNLLEFARWLSDTTLAKTETGEAAWCYQPIARLIGWHSRPHVYPDRPLHASSANRAVAMQAQGVVTGKAGSLERVYQLLDAHGSFYVDFPPGSFALEIVNTIGKPARYAIGAVFGTKDVDGGYDFLVLDDAQHSERGYGSTRDSRSHDYYMHGCMSGPLEFDPTNHECFLDYAVAGAAVVIEEFFEDPAPVILEGVSLGALRRMPTERQRRKALEDQGLFRLVVPAERRRSAVNSGARTVNVRYEVSGHWRLQPCGPGRKDRRRVWVHAHHKGPEDAPKAPRRSDLYRIDVKEAMR